MKVSLNTIRFLNEHHHTTGDPAPEGADKLIEKIGAQLAAVEEVVDFGSRFEDVLIVKVMECNDHPNADRLHVCKVDDGGKAQNVERDEQGLVQVVCGAPNVHAGMLAAWLPPGSTVPNTVGKDPFVLEARELRGVVSNGMLASPRELSLGDSHEGILEIVLDSDEHVEPGTPLVDAYHLRGDVIIDMENKMFTHRPDCFGWMGIARELEGIQHRAYHSPEWYRQDAPIPEPEVEVLPVEVRNELPDLAPRFMAVAMRDVSVGPSPAWLQIDLAKAGIRSINNIVDYSNFFMLLTGQPIHIYDYDKVAQKSENGQATLVVRHPREDEKLMLLNGKEIIPRAKAIMIATDQHLLGLAGVMGGGDTEVDESTKNILIECATFDMYSIRRTSMAHGLFTDAVTRYTKGQSPLQNRAVLAKIVEEIGRNVGGKVASPVIDDNHADAMVKTVTTHADFINQRLGLQLSADGMATLLKNVEFEVAVEGDQLTVTAPFWRTDIEIPEDVVEEVGRLYGYDHLPLELPKRDLTPAVKDANFELKKALRETLSRMGANEVLTYSFVHGNLLDAANQNRDLAFQVANALSPDLQYYRLSLTPSLLDKVHANIKAGHDQFALFELNKVHSTAMMDDAGLPMEFMRIALVFATEDKKAQTAYAGAPYYQARRFCLDLLKAFGLTRAFAWQPLKDADFGGHQLIEQMAKPFEPNRSAALVRDGIVMGIVGEYRASVRRALKLPAFAAGFELFHSPFAKAEGRSYAPLPRFPRVEQDICLKVSADTTYLQVLEFVWQHLDQHRPDQTAHNVRPVDIYQRPDDPDHKQITLRLSMASFERTLTADEVNKLLDEVAQAAKSVLGAERV